MSELEPECWVSQEALDNLHEDGSHVGTKTVLWNNPDSKNGKVRVALFTSARAEAAEAKVAALTADLAQARMERDRLIANPGAERYWEGRWRDEAATAAALMRTALAWMENIDPTLVASAEEKFGFTLFPSLKVEG